jgi:hypothetical protein
MPYQQVPDRGPKDSDKTMLIQHSNNRTKLKNNGHHSNTSSHSHTTNNSSLSRCIHPFRSVFSPPISSRRTQQQTIQPFPTASTPTPLFILSHRPQTPPKLTPLNFTIFNSPTISATSISPYTTFPSQCPQPLLFPFHSSFFSTNPWHLSHPTPAQPMVRFTRCTFVTRNARSVSGVRCGTIMHSSCIVFQPFPTASTSKHATLTTSRLFQRIW